MLFFVSAKLIYFFNIRFDKIRKEFIEILLPEDWNKKCIFAPRKNQVK